jgi:hypothetical protein
MTNLILTCYKSIIACQEHEEEEMGAGLSQDHEASQLQPNKEASQSTVPLNQAEAVEISIQAKPRPRETIARTTEEAKQSDVVHVHVHENNRSKAILKQHSTNSLVWFSSFFLTSYYLFNFF